MTVADYTMVLRSREGYGRRVPSQEFGLLLARLAPMVRRTTCMAFTGRSSLPGPIPSWLKHASDLRFVGIEGDWDTVVHIEIPRLEEAAPRLYEQTEFWPTRPPGDATGIDLLYDVLRDVRGQVADSLLFDRSLLQSVNRFGSVLNGGFQEVDFADHRVDSGSVVVDEELVANARSLALETPAPQRVRLVATLDMLRESTCSFGLLLDDGTAVRGVYLGGNMKELGELFGQSVLVLGDAVYRPSGSLLRVDAEQVTSGAGQASFWSRVPDPIPRTVVPAQVRRRQTARTGASAIFGRWPGDESEEELLAALNAME